MSADRKQILLAEPDERTRQIIAPSLEAGGYEVEVVTGTLDALTVLYKRPIDLVIASATLSDGDGFELLGQVRLDPATRNSPFVLLTEDEADVQKARDAGASEVVLRPIRVRAFTDLIADLVPASETVDDARKALPLDSIFTVEYRSFVAHLGSLPETANAVIRMFDGKRTLGQAIAECDVPDDEARGMIPTLVDAQVLVPAPGHEEDVGRWLSGLGRTPSALPVARDSVDEPLDGEQRRLEEEARAAEAAAAAAAEAARNAAEAARAKAEEARQRAEEEKRRRAEEERRRVEAELQELDAEARRIQASRQAELDAAREEADRMLRDVEARAAALEAEARRKATTLDQQATELGERKRAVTARLATLSTSGAITAAPVPAAPAPAGATTSAHGQAVEAHRETERRAMESQTAGATIGFSPQAATAAEATLAFAPDAPAAPTDHAEPEPAAVGSFEDDFFGAAPVAPAAPAAEDDLFAEPERDGVPPIVWAIAALLLIGLIVVLFSSGSGERSTPTTPVASEGAAATTGAPTDEPGTESAVEQAEADVDPEQALAAAFARAGAEASGGQAAGEVVGTANAFAADPDAAEAPEPEPVAPAAPPAPARTEPAQARQEAPREERREERAAAPQPAGDAENALALCAELSAGSDYAATVTACQDAVRQNPRNSEAYANLGKANYEVDNVSAAINYLEQAVRLNSRNRDALLALGAAKQDAGDVSGAREAYESYLEISPDSRRAAEVRTILESL